MDFNFDKVISDEFDWSIVDKAIHDEVVRLKERITHLIQEPDNGMDAEASAIEMAQALDLDAAIRTVAKSGRNHNSGPNWHYESDWLAISATFGAGTNSATVRAVSNDEAINHLLLYNANDYGRHITAFRKGPWVHRLIAYAQVLRRANEIEKREEEREAATRRSDKFKAVNF